MASPEESGVLRQLIQQIDSEISTFRADDDGFTTGQSSAVGSNESLESHPAVVHPSGTQFPIELEPPPHEIFTEQGKAIFGDSSEWIQAELYRSGSVGGMGPRAPQLIPNSPESPSVPSSFDQAVPSSDEKISMTDSSNNNMVEDALVPQNDVDTVESRADMVHDHSFTSSNDDINNTDDRHSHATKSGTSYEAPRLLELSFSSSDLTSLIDTAGSLGVDNNDALPLPPTIKAIEQVADSSVPVMMTADAKDHASFPPKQSSLLKEAIVANGEKSKVATVTTEETTMAAILTEEDVRNTSSMESSQPPPTNIAHLESSSSSAMEDVEPAVVPRKHGSFSARDQGRKRLSLITTGVGLAAASSSTQPNNELSSYLDLPAWELAPLSPPVFVKESTGSSLTVTVLSNTTNTTTTTTTTGTATTTTTSTTVTSTRSPPPTRKLPPPPIQQDNNDDNTMAAPGGQVATPVSATAMMTPTTPLSTREARILAGREVLLRSSPESHRSAHRTASIMTTSSTTSSLATTASDRKVPTYETASMSSGDSMSSGGGTKGVVAGTIARYKVGMGTLQYWKQVQEQEQQNLKGAGGVMGAIPGRGRMIEVCQPSSAQQGQSETTFQDRNKEVEVSKEGIIKVRPERLVFPDQSIRPIPLKAFRVRKMTLAERNQAYAQACHDFAKARTGLDVWILRSMMQDRPELMKNPPACVTNAQKAQEYAMAGRRTSKDISQMYHNNNQTWNATSPASVSSPMSASTPLSASGMGFGTVSSTTASSFVGGARAKIKNAGKRLSMEISQGFSAAGGGTSTSPLAEDGRRSSMSTHSQQSIRASTPSSDRYKNGGVESPFYKQKTTRSAVELGSWSSQRARTYSAQQHQQHPQELQQPPAPQGGMVPSGPPLSSSYGSQRESFHQYDQQHQHQQQQGPMYVTPQRASSMGTPVSGDTSPLVATMNAAGYRQRHSISGPRGDESGSGRGRASLDLPELSQPVNHRHSFMDIGGSGTGNRQSLSPNFNSVSSRRRSLIGPGTESSERFTNSSGFSSFNDNGVRSSTLPSLSGAGSNINGSGHKHEISRSTSISSLSSTSSATPTTASTGSSSMAPSMSSTLSHSTSQFGTRRRPMSMMVSTTLTSLAEHQALATESPISASTPDSMGAAGMVGTRSSLATTTATTTTTMARDPAYNSVSAQGSGGLSIPLADETTSKEIYSPLTSPIIIPEGGFNIQPGSALALRAAAMNASPPTPREGGGGGMTRPLTFAGYGPSTMNISSLALGPASSTANMANDSNNGISPKSSKKKKDGYDSLVFKKSFRRDISDKRASKLGLSLSTHGPISPLTSPLSAGGSSNSSGSGGGMMMETQGSIMTMNISEVLWEQSLDKLSDVLPHVDRDRLLIYLQRAGGDEMVAIGLAMCDLRSGDL
ncbi:hypothetical protein BGW42_004091 [Actinomortierella wolfii]|nr:hypothetical protein BGW42_004091 [Actinomortierella wolfii]